MIVPLKSLDAIRRVQPQFAALSQYSKKTDGNTGPYFVTRETVSRSAQVHARNLIPAGEDPVTGSAGGCCAAWMVKHAWAQSDESVIIRLEVLGLIPLSDPVHQMSGFNLSRSPRHR
jgi:predicted PhzF superfamily epimerase YddE/YHI9